MSLCKPLRPALLFAILLTTAACGKKNPPEGQKPVEPAETAAAAPESRGPEKTAKGEADVARLTDERAPVRVGSVTIAGNAPSTLERRTAGTRQEPQANVGDLHKPRLGLAFDDKDGSAGDVQRLAKPGWKEGEGHNTDSYERIFDNPYKLVKNDPLSTISSAVDTASYTNVRGMMNAGKLPPKDAVRIADMLNYFRYDYAAPKNGDPVAFSLEIAPCPWQPKNHLLRIGLKAKTIDKSDMPPRNLTFLIDTSGSMNAPNRLPLVKESLKLLVQQLTEKDRVSIVTYAGNAGLALPPTPGSEKDTIMRTIDTFNAGGSTNGEGGLKAAYDQAQAGFIKGGVNRVILATDGDFNVGQSSDAEMVRLIEQKRDTGVYLTVLGYGMGNLKDSKLEQIAHHGNGHYAYIDTLDEAKKVFVEQAGALTTVAKDVKLQVEFNPAKVAGYRLIGYENRVMRNEDFRNDKKDAGDMGSGHMCTALYEIVPNGEKVDSTDVEPLKYQTTPKLSDAAKSGEWATVRMRYKHPETEKAQEVEAPLKGEALGQKVTNDFEFATCVASFGMLLRDSEYKGMATYQSVLETAQGLLRDKKDDYREEFVKLVRVALTLEQAKK